MAMSWCVKKRGPVFTAAFSPLVQIMAALIDIPILHENLYLGKSVTSSSHFEYCRSTIFLLLIPNLTVFFFDEFDSLLGSLIVIFGLYILLWGKKKEMQNFVSKLAQEAEENKTQEPHLPVITVSCDSRPS